MGFWFCLSFWSSLEKRKRPLWEMNLTTKCCPWETRAVPLCQGGPEQNEGSEKGGSVCCSQAQLLPSSLFGLYRPLAFFFKCSEISEIWKRLSTSVMRSSGWWKLLTVPYFIYGSKEKLPPCMNLASVPSSQVLLYLLSLSGFSLRKMETKSCTWDTVHTHEASVWNELKSPVDLFNTITSASVARKPYFMSGEIWGSSYWFL